MLRAATLFCVFVAMVIAPWLMLRLRSGRKPPSSRRRRSWRRRPRPPLSPLCYADCALAEVSLDIPYRGWRLDLAGAHAVGDQSVTVNFLPFDKKSKIAAV